MAQLPSIPKGTRDYSPEIMVKRNYIFDTIKSVFRLYKASFIVRRSDGEEGKDGEDNFNFNKHCKKERGKWNEKSKVITKILGIFAGFLFWLLLR